MEWMGLGLLVLVGVGIVCTGLPAAVVLVAVASFGAILGIATGAIDVAVLGALPNRLINLFENDLLQALPLYVTMGLLLDRLPVADALYRAGNAALPRSPSAPLVSGMMLGALLGPMNGSVGASVLGLSRVVSPRLAAERLPAPNRHAIIAASVCCTLCSGNPVAGNEGRRTCERAAHASSIAIRPKGTFIFIGCYNSWTKPTIADVYAMNTSEASQKVHDEIVSLLPRLRRFARNLTRSPHDADDVLQIALERAITRLDQWHSDARLDSWLFKIIRNAWIDELRARGRRDKVFIAAEEGENVGSDPIAKQTEMMSVQAAIGRLSEEQREVVSLVLIEGLPYKEAAQVLDVPIGTLTSRLARAREALQAMLGGESM